MKSSMSTRLASYLLLLLGSALAHAQTATQDVQIWFPPEAGEKPIELQEMVIHSQIQGWIASTRIELRFHNPNARVLEGELVLPLRPEQLLAGYALDIDGKLREGVVVPKQTARVAFEEITRRGVDPGLAELTRGNVFRTRVYPLPAGGTRQIALTIEQPLKRVGNVLQYRFPVPYANKLANYRVKIEVDPTLADRNTLVLENRQVAERNLRNAKPEAMLSLDVPIKSVAPLVAFKDDNSEISAQLAVLAPLSAPEFQPTVRPKPKVIALYFDASRSAHKRDLARERAMLARLFETLQSVDVQLVVFRDNSEPMREFKIRGGDASVLLATLNDLALDGATSFERVSFSQPADLSIIFTDGDGNYEPYQVIRTRMIRPGMVIALSTDTPSKKGLARLQHDLSANVVQLAPESSAAELDNLLHPRLIVNATAPSGQCSGMPAIGPIVDGSSHLAWRCAPGTTITLNWQVGTQRHSERIVLPAADKAARAPTSLQRIWASNYIDAMERADDGQGALELATRFGVVTEQTSLLVLETLEDYVRYQVRPPELEWQAEFDARMAAVQRETQPDLAGLISEWQSFKSWHEQPHTPLKTLAQDYASRNARRIDRSYHPALAKRAAALNKQIAATAEGDEKGLQTLLRAAHQLKHDWLASLSEAQRNAYMDDYDKAKGLDSETDSDVGLSGSASESPRRQMAPVPEAMPAPAPMLAAEAETLDVAASAAPAAKPAEMAAPVTELADDVAGKQITGGSVQLQAYRADTGYLSALRASKTPYQDYLKLAEQDSSFGFFLDCARFFWEEQNDQALAIRVLSNLAELQVEDTTAVRMLAHQLKQWQRWNEALAMFDLARSQREEEPQGWRDMALTLALAPEQDRGNRALALAYLWKIASHPYPRFHAIRLTALHEFNHWLARTPAAKRPDLKQMGVPAELIGDVPLGLRVVLGWNLDNVDMDLWVRDPLGEWAYYSQPQSLSGGQMSDDFTQGYGPETFTIARALPGTYSVFVHYYADHQQKLSVPSVVYLDLYSPYHGQDTQVQSTMRSLKAGEEQHFIGEFVVP